MSMETNTSQDADAKARRFMSAIITYTDEPMDDIRVVADFLPSPEELAFREESVKVTISLSKKSVEFFKAQGRGYQTAINKVLRRYVESHKHHRKSAA